MPLPQVPRSASELIVAIQQGILIEGHNFDAKAELEHGPRGNARLAIDLAAFAVSGGLITIGIAEDSETASRLIPRPIRLAGLRERVSAVGLSRVDPPLYSTTLELMDPDAGEGYGYLLIVVPPSPDAPHMVDGKYRGRSDTTNYVLGDADVRRVQAQRRGATPNIAEVLDRAVQHDPTPPSLSQHAHLFVVARPVVATSPVMLQERLGREWRSWIRDELVNRPQWGLFSPDLPNNATLLVRRPDGWAATTEYIGLDRTVQETALEDYLLELEVHEDGGLALFCGRASDSHSGSATRWTFEDLLAGLTWRVIRAAAAVSAKTDYLGNWDFGVALTNARGIASHALVQRSQWADPFPYAAGTYISLTQATYAEVSEHRHDVVVRLLGRLNRALNDDAIPLRDFDQAMTSRR